MSRQIPCNSCDFSANGRCLHEKKCKNVLELENVLKELLDNSDSFYSAIEAHNCFDLKKWTKKVMEILENKE